MVYTRINIQVKRTNTKTYITKNQRLIKNAPKIFNVSRTPDRHTNCFDDSFTASEDPQYE